MKNILNSIILGFTCLIAGKVAAQTLPTIRLHYSVRPPYVIQEANFDVGGLTATPAIDAFKKAKIPYQLHSTPTNRQLMVLQKNEGFDCALGWFKSAEREKFANYSAALYKAKPFAIITHKDFVTKDQSFESLLKNRSNRILVRDQFSYGEFIDGLLKSLKPNILSTTVDSQQMFQMVKSKRADIMFCNMEEAEYALKSLPSDLMIYTPPDSPEGPARYIICSKKVPLEVIEKLNLSLSHKDHAASSRTHSVVSK
jgi:uncharacterized protein (TIGR02285 family)